jgi:hypothetical protein
VHDIADLERRGVPGVYVASAVFEHAADAQGAAIGFHPSRVLVRHPIQDRTDEEMETIAATSVDSIITQLLTPRSTSG